MTNKTLLQGFEWYLPDNGLLWQRLKEQAPELKKSGISMIWLPPAYKGAAGKCSVGYDVYDTYDLGEFDQKGSVSTKYGTKEEYLEAVRSLQAEGIEVLVDVVLNHMMGADATEEVMVEENVSWDRNHDVKSMHKISAWTKFEFPGRNKYSDFAWNATHFSGTDWDDAGKRNGIFQFQGKNWNRETDSEHGNYDYLMGVDLDMDNPETVDAVTKWGKWYLDTVGMDGVRLDAVKHISFDFYRQWLQELRAYAKRDFFAVGEYWSSDLGKLLHYLDATDNSLSLFDVPLHFAFFKAATSNGQQDMGALFNHSLVKHRPACAVTFVDNHDTQPGQALQSFVPAWFKPIAYAFILLRNEGIPCVFYGDYYGIPHDNVAPVRGLSRLLMLRAQYAYGEQTDYFDHHSVVGFTRLGDDAHPDSGMAVLATDSVAGQKNMYVGKRFAGEVFRDALDNVLDSVTIDGDGNGNFFVKDGSVSVWVPERVYKKIYLKVKEIM